MFEEDILILKEFHDNAGHSKNSIKSYQTAFNKYRIFHKMSLTELIKEAKIEQEKHIPESKLRLFDRLNTFKQYLIKNHIGNTVTSTLNKIKTFYKYNRITLPFIPPINRKTINQHDYISYEDLLTREELLKGLNIANNNLKCWILIMLCSGSTRNECKSITNQIFFDGTYEYHEKDDYIDALKILSKRDDVVCTCKLVRQKTKKPYYTFLNPETVQQIAKTKLIEGGFILKDPLLRHTEDYIGKQCKFINDYLNMGKAGGYSRFRPHMFRKWHATRLNQGYENNMTMDDIDQLQGRGKTLTRESYFKNNPEILKLNYIKAMNNVSLYNKYSYEIKNGIITIKTEY